MNQRSIKKEGQKKEKKNITYFKYLGTHTHDRKDIYIYIYKPYRNQQPCAGGAQ
jgi:hypothetical protein